MSAADTTTTTGAVAEQPDPGQPAPVYPMPRPESGNDPRFCLGLIYDVGKVLQHYGYPPVVNGRDFAWLQLALFGYIYQQETTP